MGSALIRQLSGFSDVKVKAMIHRSLVNIPGCEVRPGDLNNSVLMSRALAGIDTVVHLAALTKSSRVSDYFHINVAGTKNLIDACAEQGVKKILYISSRAASLDGGGYASSKLKAEECVRKSGLKWVILRPSEVYGQGGGGINRLIRWIQRYPCVPVIGIGKSKLSPVYIDDVVSAMLLSIFDEKLENETIVLAGPEELTYDELVDRIAAYFGVNRLKIRLSADLVKWVAVGLSKLGVNILAPDQIPRLLSEKPYGIGLAREKLNYSPRYLEDGIEKFYHKE
jgi:NADH dehydrogenase